ncbi:MAG: Hsp20/alpha crystallin family protein [Flavobacteriales bacterium]|nr:Hsp20/alpha crystallin family protein [Flavobacteriales bacterium]
MNNTTSKNGSKKDNELKISQFEITQLLREVNPSYRIGVTPLSENKRKEALGGNLKTSTSNKLSLAAQQLAAAAATLQTQTLLTPPTLTSPEGVLQNNLAAQQLTNAVSALQAQLASPLNVSQNNLAAQQLSSASETLQSLLLTDSLDSSSSLMQSNIVSQQLLDSKRSSTSENTAMANVLEDDDQFDIELSVAGYSKEEITYKVSNGILRVTGNKDKKASELAICYVTQEFTNNSFRRSFILSEDVDSSKIKARLSNGILTLEIPKTDLALTKEKKISEVMTK